MSGPIARRYAEFVAERSTLVVVGLVLLTVVVGAGATVGDSDQAGIGQFDVDSPETDAADYVQENYGEDDRLVSQFVVREEGGDVLTRESLIAGLELQREAKRNGAIDDTLAGQGFVGIENLVAFLAIQEEGAGGPAASDGNTAGSQPVEPPSLDAQIDALESHSDAEVEALLATLLDENAALPVDEDPYDLLPRSYEPGSTSATARLTLLFQVAETTEDEVPQAAYDAQVAIDDLGDERFADAFVYGQGISDDASSRAVGDSFAIILPFALVLIVVVLGIAYRDLLDFVLAIVGIVGVMVWLAGIMGWLQIPMNQILIAVPFLLIGLSIDYALHVVMRYREARTHERGGEASERGVGANERGVGANESGVGGDGKEVDNPAVTHESPVRSAMTIGLGGVVLALAAATFSTGVGFLSNVVSPLPAIQDFAVLSAGGILATFVVFGGLVPALKVEVDSFVEERLGRSRRKPAFGVESGLVNRGLAGLATLCSRGPLVVLLVAVVLASAGAAGATTIDTEFNQADFLPEDPPAWTARLPGPLEPGSYSIRADLGYLSDQFQLQGQGGQSEVLIRGNVTDPAMLAAVDAAGERLDDGQGSSIQRRVDGSGAIDGPHTLVRDLSTRNATVGAAVDQRDTDGDGLPDRDLGTVYALLFAADPGAASEVLSRNAEGEVTSARLLVSVRSEESAQTIADDTRALAGAIEQDGGSITAVATGPIVTSAVFQDALLETLVQAFVVTLVVIFAFLTALFWYRYRSPLQGAIILLPVVIALCWLLGAMALLDIPFNSETAVITSLAIGLGVDYSIHAGERFVSEREERESLEAALEGTITGTGGALLASATTTAAGFGVLALALAPPLKRFGTVTAFAIVLAFVSSVTVLPCLMVLRERVRNRLED